MKTDAQTPPHPYYPLGAVIAGYVAPTLSTPEILAIFTVTCVSILVPTWLYINYTRPDLPRGHIAVALWFVLCGCIHLGLEGTQEVDLLAEHFYCALRSPRNSPVE